MGTRTNGRRGLATAGLCLLALGALAQGASRWGGTAARDAVPIAPWEGAAPGVALAATGALVSAADADGFGADPLTVEPRVPRAAGAPCIVELFRDRVFEPISSEAPTFFYVPSPVCVGPWAKVTMVVELAGPREPRDPVSILEIAFDSEAGGSVEYVGGPVVPLFTGSPQEHDGLPLWRLERDVTDLAPLFGQVQLGILAAQRDNYYHDDLEPSQIRARSAKLLFYRASPETPAQRVPDLVRVVPTGTDGGGGSWDWPRNIERIYLDVLVRPNHEGNDRFWYACVADELAAAYPQLRSAFAIGDYRGNIQRLSGCTGGSFREAEVLIDGERAGLVPVLPWLPGRVLLTGEAVLDLPAPGVQALNMVPYRVDLTPFAARLSDGASHSIEVDLHGGGAYARAYALVYLDHGSAQVTGALTRNTLAAQPAVPTVTDGLGWDEQAQTLEGDVDTRLERRYSIEGYVDTSKGRVYSSVWQRSLFAHRNTFRIVGPEPTGRDDYEHDFTQKIRLSSTVDRVSRRVRDGVLLAEHREYVSYPLLLDVRHAGRFQEFDDYGGPSAELIWVAAHQARGIRASHYRKGMPRYRTEVADVFDTRYGWTRPPGTSPGEVTEWRSRREYLFTDSFGSCYSAGLTTGDGLLLTRTRGTACPNGRNGIRWYAHPDGSPDGLGWAPSP